jgi:hypothetical protein
MENPKGYRVLTEWLNDMDRVAEIFSEETQDLPFSRSLRLQCDRAAQRIKRLRDGSDDALAEVLHEIVLNIQAELEDHTFFTVPPERAEWYHEDDRPLFGQAVADVFPDSTREIAEAGRCYALARWTASVFHLMRAVELTLHKWSDELGLSLRTPAAQANWQDILNGADKKLKDIEQNQPKSPQRDADLEYFGDASAHFRAIKDAWRNHVSHSKATYDEAGSLGILQHVKAFMGKLASRPASTTTP